MRWTSCGRCCAPTAWKATASFRRNARFRKSLGVSRRAIRRALEVLEAEGLIWRRQGSGTYAGRRPDGWSEHVDSIVAGTDLMEVMEVRLRVEPQLAQLAAMRAKARRCRAHV